MAADSMIESGLAGRYALALLELAEEKKSLDAVAEDLRGLKGLLEESEDLQRLIRSPRFGRDDQAKAMQAVLDKAGANELTKRFVSVVTANRRLFALSDIISAYLNELARRRGEITAEVIAARELTDAQKDKLVESLKKAVGAKVQVDVKIDASLLGGLIVKVGSRMIDGSIKTKLAKLQVAMKGVG
ncbi:MAG: F0F1 ATP synthase subunit delta [Limibacillus sp.]